MIHEKARSPAQTDWFLSARNGNLTVRVQPGTRLGETPAGEISLHTAHGAVEMDVADDGRLVLTRASDIYEIEMGQRTLDTVYIDPTTPARIILPNNVLSLSTQFASTRRSGKPLEIAIIQLPGTHSLAAARADSEALVNEIPASATKPAGNPHALADRILALGNNAPVVSEVDTLQSLAHDIVRYCRNRLANFKLPPVLVTPMATGVVVGIVLMLAFVVTQHSADTPVVESAPVAALPDVATEVATPTADAREVVADTESASAADSEALPISPMTTLIGDQVPEARTDADNAVATSIAKLLEAQQLPEPPVVDFAVHSLKTLLTAYPLDEQLRQQLEALTLRLVDEAKVSFDRGDAAAAGRLIAQASTSGVAEEYVQGAMEYLARPRQPSATSSRATATQDELNPRGQSRSELPTPVAVRVAPAEPNEPPVDDVSTVEPRTPGTMPAPMKRDLQALQAALMERAQGLLDAPDMAQTLAALDDARAAGVDEDALAALREQASERQLLLAAQRGDFSRLYPFSRLTPIRRDPPDYPRFAPLSKEVSVDIEMTITESGDVRDVETRGVIQPYFTREARRAVKRWRFEPVLLDGDPVPVRTSVRVTFRG